jgi:hypothetical protein
MAMARLIAISLTDVQMAVQARCAGHNPLQRGDVGFKGELQ